jgi:nucleoside-diphosphate-sugar epimerase
MTSQRTVLLTGASGVVGTALLPKLAHHNVIALVHRQPPPQGVAGHVTGDLVAPGMGLAEDVARRLAAQVDVVVHCAAVTDFYADAGATAGLNVTGTAQVLEFTRRAEATIHYLSTAFVARSALTRTTAGEGRVQPADYLASKLAAEELVRHSGLPATIVRPSVVIGDSGTGVISKFQGLHKLALAVLRNDLPLLPLDPAAHIDFVPQDHLAGAVAALMEAGVTEGEYWVTAGERALTTRTVIDVLAGKAGELGIPFTPPRLVEPDMVDRLVRPVFIDPLPRDVRGRFDDMLAMTALFVGADPFPSTVGDIPGCRSLTETELVEAFHRSLGHLAVAKGLGTANSEAA